MARYARGRLSLDDRVVDDTHAAHRDEILALLDAARRHISDDPDVRIAHGLRLLFIFRNLDDPTGDRFGELLRCREKQIADDAGLRDDIAFHDTCPLHVLARGKVTR